MVKIPQLVIGLFEPFILAFQHVVLLNDLLQLFDNLRIISGIVNRIDRMGRSMGQHKAASHRHGYH